MILGSKRKLLGNTSNITRLIILASKLKLVGKTYNITAVNDSGE